MSEFIAGSAGTMREPGSPCPSKIKKSCSAAMCRSRAGTSTPPTVTMGSPGQLYARLSKDNYFSDK